VKDTFDYIIAGAGCAGLSLLWRVLHSPLKEASILLVDRTLEPSADKTWCFWGTDDLPFQHLAERSWDRMAVGFPETRIEEPLQRNTYHCVRSERYHTYIMEQVATRSNVTCLEMNIQAIHDTEHGASLLAGGQRFEASHIFQSCFLSPYDKSQPVHYPLRQHFGGWEVVTEEPIFTPDVVTLMDFDTDQHGATIFYYVLPFSPTRGLVEYTVFSPDRYEKERYDEAIHAYLRNLTDAPYEILRTEYGVIPMEERPRHQRYGKHITSLGTVGGITKPTTGYTFQRVQAHTSELVQSMTATGKPATVSVSSPRYRFYDLLLLRILYEHPHWGRPIFRRLFEHNSIDRVLSFIGEETHLGQDALIFSRLPYAPFLKAIVPNIPLLPRVLFPSEPEVNATPADESVARAT